LAGDELVAGETRLWFNRDVVSDAEIADCQARGIESRLLSEAVDPRRQVEVAEAIEVIEAEFPEQTVMAEYC